MRQFTTKRPGNRRDKPPPKPLNAAGLEELGLAYVARFAVSAAKLDAYLRRKLRERGWAGEGEPVIDAIVERFVASGYVDDAAYARSKTGSLLRRGYGMRRVSQALGAAGIGEEARAAAPAAEDDRRRAALVMARKRRLGPFGPRPADRAAREKQIGAMLRAGHPLDSARELVDAPSIEAAEEWAAQAIGNDACD